VNILELVFSFVNMLALLVGGKRLRFLMILVAMISTLGSFNALLFTTYEMQIPILDKISFKDALRFVVSSPFLYWNLCIKRVSSLQIEGHP
jgi:hypothetical protein